MGQAFGAEGHDRGKLSENASKKDIHPDSTPTYNHHIYQKKRHWAIYKDYFDDSYHSPRKFLSSSFLFSKDQDLHSFIHSFVLSRECLKIPFIFTSMSLNTFMHAYMHLYYSSSQTTRAKNIDIPLLQEGEGDTPRTDV